MTFLDCHRVESDISCAIFIRATLASAVLAMKRWLAGLHDDAKIGANLNFSQKLRKYEIQDGGQ